eukprot:Skav234436  [mRNA]  locus=scaffold1999:16921:17688:- [translate_table: standard]
MEMYPPDKSLYFVLNEALRAQKREKVKPWRDVILLLLTAMKKLPPVQDRVVHRAVKDFSLFPTENEILLPPNMEFRVKSVLDCGNDLTMVQCDQLEETDPLMDFSIAKAAVPG